MKVLGVDPGLRISGYALLERQRRDITVRDAGVLRADEDLPLEQRLCQLYTDSLELLHEHQPDVMAVEDLYAHYKHPRTAILMGHARGMFLLAAARNSVEVQSYAATRIKKSLTGNGRAGKEQMQHAICNRLALARPPQPADVADALALALCCIQETNLSITP